MIADKACYERGCACHDSKDKDGVEVVEKRDWIGLTDEETAELVHRYAFYELTRQIEAKLKEKNT